MSVVKRTALVVVTAVLLTTAYLFSAPANSGFTAEVKNPSSNLGSGASFLTASGTSGTHCTSVPAAGAIPIANSFPCIGSQFPTVPATGAASAGELLKASGSIDFTSATYNATSCGVVQLINSTTPSNPMIPRKGVTYNGTGPTSLTGSGSIGYDGATTQSADIIQSATGLYTFSVGVWFKTSLASGALVEYNASSSNATPTQYDRHIYFLGTGQLVFGTYTAGPNTITTPSGTSYADGAWHYALATVQSGATKKTSLQSLYVDGGLQASASIASALGAQTTAGYWHLGYGKTTTAEGWTGTGNYFNGQLSNASVFTLALTLSQVTSLYSSTSQAGFASTVASLSPYAFWALDDTGLATYSGSLPVVGTTSPCSAVQVTVGTSGKCLYPTLLTACPALSPTYLLSGLTSQPVTALAPSTLAVSQTITSTVGRDSTYNTGYDVGLNLLVPVAVTEKGFLNNTFTWSSSLVIA